MKVRNLGFLEFPNYEVDDQGNVWSLNYHQTGERRMLKPSVHTDGYLKVVLCNNGKVKMFYVHQLVAFAFLGDWSMWGLDEVNHKDENKQNNRLENIELCTHLYNMRYGTRLEKVSKKVNQYTKDGQFIRTFNSLTEASHTLNISQSSISLCLKGRYKSAGNFIWKYKDVSS